MLFSYTITGAFNYYPLGTCVDGYVSHLFYLKLIKEFHTFFRSVPKAYRSNEVLIYSFKKNVTAA